MIQKTNKYITFFFRQHTHFNAQYFCSKPCYGLFKQFIRIRYQNEIVLQELDFKIKPYGFSPTLS